MRNQRGEQRQPIAHADIKQAERFVARIHGTERGAHRSVETDVPASPDERSKRRPIDVHAGFARVPHPRQVRCSLSIDAAGRLEPGGFLRTVRGTRDVPFARRHQRQIKPVERLGGYSSPEAGITMSAVILPEFIKRHERIPSLNQSQGFIMLWLGH